MKNENLALEIFHNNAMKETNLSAITFHLRDYQKECLEAILERYRAGMRRQLTCLPTGSGKTVIFAEFPRYFKMKKQMLVLAHRKIAKNQVELAQVVRGAGKQG